MVTGILSVPGPGPDRPGAAAARRKPRLLLHCQYVYGIGHLVRSLELARSLGGRFDIHLLNGGEPVPNFPLPPEVRLHQLPAIYKDEASGRLVPVEPGASLEACFRRRAELIGAAVDELVPDLLITEHFPFGQLFEAEVLPLIARVKDRNPAARIVASVRDVVESARGGVNDDHVCDILNRWYDAVLVHGDEAVIPFSASFPLVGRIAIPLHHTGYVVRTVAGTRPPVQASAGLPVLVASVGGGRIGAELLQAMLRAHPALSARWPHRLVLYTGAFQRDGAELRSHVAESRLETVTVAPFDGDRYRSVLATASAVVCLGGYNSMLEAVSTGLPVLVYQRRFLGGNQEQELRIQLFERLGLVVGLTADDLSVEPLTRALLEAVAAGTGRREGDGAGQGAGPLVAVDCGGGRRSLAILEAMMTDGGIPCA